jgi:hypothetical protein
MYTCIWTFLVRARVCIQTDTLALCVYLCRKKHVCMHVCIYTHVYELFSFVLAFAYKRTRWHFVCTFVGRIYIYIYIYICMYIYIHARAHARMVRSCTHTFKHFVLSFCARAGYMYINADTHVHTHIHSHTHAVHVHFCRRMTHKYAHTWTHTLTTTSDICSRSNIRQSRYFDQLAHTYACLSLRVLHTCLSGKLLVQVLGSTQRSVPVGRLAFARGSAESARCLFQKKSWFTDTCVYVHVCVWMYVYVYVCAC